MAPVIAIVFLVLPIAELAVLIAVGQQIGIGPTIVSLIAISIAGALLAKREGIGVWRRFRSTMAAGQIPSSEVVDGFLVLFGAALLLTPGFITDLLGLLMLLPPSRAAIRRALRKGGGLLLLRRFPIVGVARTTSSRYKKAQVVHDGPVRRGSGTESGANRPTKAFGEVNGGDGQ